MQLYLKSLQIMKNIFFSFNLLFISFIGIAQSYNHSEIGIEIQAASFSTHGGTVGGAVKYAYVLGDDFAFGPSVRMQYIWSKNTYTGFKGNRFVWGGGAFAHYRFLEWFFIGAEAEYLKNPYYFYTTSYEEKPWKMTAFVGGGISKAWGRFRLNAAIYYDLVDGLRPINTPSQSPLRGDYFLKISNPQNPNYGKMIPLIYRLAFFINLSDPNKSSKVSDFDY